LFSPRDAGRFQRFRVRVGWRHAVSSQYRLEV
jgi:hypothetical protein